MVRAGGRRFRQIVLTSASWLLSPMNYGSDADRFYRHKIKQFSKWIMRSLRLDYVVFNNVIEPLYPCFGFCCILVELGDLLWQFSIYSYWMSRKTSPIISRCPATKCVIKENECPAYQTCQSMSLCRYSSPHRNVPWSSKYRNGDRTIL